MVMDTIQVRLSRGLVERIDDLVQTGMYSSRSDVLRDAVRRLVLDKLVGIVPNTTNSIKEMKELRKQFSKEKFNLNKINKLVD